MLEFSLFLFLYFLVSHLSIILSFIHPLFLSCTISLSIFHPSFCAFLSFFLCIAINSYALFTCFLLFLSMQNFECSSFTCDAAAIVLFGPWFQVLTVVVLWVWVFCSCVTQKWTVAAIVPPHQLFFSLLQQLVNKVHVSIYKAQNTQTIHTHCTQGCLTHTHVCN